MVAFSLRLKDHHMNAAIEMRSREPRGTPMPSPNVSGLEDADEALDEGLDEGAGTTMLGQSTLNCVMLGSFPMHWLRSIAYKPS